MSFVGWGRRRVLLLLCYCCRLGGCPVRGPLLGCGRGPCPVFPTCPAATEGRHYRWSLRMGSRVVGCTLLILATARQQAGGVPVGS